jgi:thiosulfate dehydrogenase
MLREEDVMKKINSRLFFIILVFVMAAVLAAGCSSSAATDAPADAPESTSPPEADSPPEPGLEGDRVRGGLLYDKWWVAAAESEGDEHEHDEDGHSAEPPEGDHPLWATQTTNERSGGDTWRCKECHGWDYKGAEGAYGDGSHFTGFVGVFQMSGSDPTDVLAALKGETNPDHDFSEFMEEQDLVDLALFISDTLIDNDDLVNADKSSKGDAAAGETLYVNVCVNCHGPEGNAINFDAIDDPEFLGHLAPGNPWEFIHKVRYGQPGWPMPSGIGKGWTNDDVADVLAYAQGFTSEPPLSGGGQLYDKWWAVLGLDAPEEDQPLWSTQSSNERSGSDTWRCKECHGWDYLGVDGAYGSGSHMTGFPGVLNASSLSADELLAWLDGSQNADHDFSTFMDEFALNALVSFMKNEAADITPYVNADKSVAGDPANGNDLFESTCSACHGIDGKRINFHDADDPEYIGTVAAGNPWEFFHKASFGQPDAPMPASVALGWTMQEIADLLAYSQTLPTE